MEDVHCPEGRRQVDGEETTMLLGFRLPAIPVELDRNLAYIKDNKPDIPYLTLIHVAFKNAKFIPLQTKVIYSFIESVFPYFKELGTPWRRYAYPSVFAYHNYFVKVPLPLTGLPMYMLNEEKQADFEAKAANWRREVNAKNVYRYGFNSMKEFNAFFDGKLTEFFRKDETLLPVQKEMLALRMKENAGTSTKDGYKEIGLGVIAMEPLESVLMAPSDKYVDIVIFGMVFSSRSRKLLSKRSAALLKQKLCQKEEVKPKFEPIEIHYDLLAYIAFKNAKFASLRAEKILSFIGTTFFGGEREENTWQTSLHLILYAANGTFIKVNSDKSGLCTAFRVKETMIQAMEERLKEWKERVTQEDIDAFGFSNKEEFDFVLNGEKTSFFLSCEEAENASSVDTSTTNERKRAAEEDPETPSGDSIDDVIDAVLKLTKKPKYEEILAASKEKNKTPVKEEVIVIDEEEGGDDHESNSEMSPEDQEIMKLAAHTVMMNRIKGGIPSVSTEMLQTASIDTQKISSQLRSLIHLAGCTWTSLGKDVLGGCDSLNYMTSHPLPWDRLSRDKQRAFVKMTVFLDEVQNAAKAIVEQRKMEQEMAGGEKDDDAKGAISKANEILMWENEEIFLKQESSANHQNPAVQANIEKVSSATDAEKNDKNSDSAEIKPEVIEKVEPYFQVPSIRQLPSMTAIQTAFKDEAEAVVSMLAAGILPTRLICSCGTTMLLMGHLQTKWMCPRCSEIVSIKRNSFLEGCSITILQVLTFFKGWLEQAKPSYVASIFKVQESIVENCNKKFRQMCQIHSGTYPKLGGDNGNVVLLDMVNFFGTRRVVSGLDPRTQKCFTAVMGADDHIFTIIDKYLYPESKFICMNSPFVDWSKGLSNVQSAPRAHAITNQLYSLETRLKKMYKKPEEVLDEYLAEVVVRQNEGTNFIDTIIRLMGELVPEPLRPPKSPRVLGISEAVNYNEESTIHLIYSVI